MRFVLEFDLDNDDFQGAAREFRAAQVLDEAARGFASGAQSGRCMDSNGNTVGRWAIEEG